MSLTKITERFDAFSQAPLTRDLGLLAIRVALAWLFIYHGGRTLFGAFNGAGLHTTALFYANIGVGGGYEIDLALAALAAALMLLGAGRLSLDALISSRLRTARSPHAQA